MTLSAALPGVASGCPHPVARCPEISPWRTDLPSMLCWLSRYIGCSTALAPPPLPLQFLLECIEEAPVGALGNDFLWGTRDHPGLLQAQRIETHRVLRVVLTPLAVDDIVHSFVSVVIAGSVPLVHQEPGRTLRPA